MIASPTDVARERTIIRETVYEWNIIHSEKRKIVLLPIGWETHSVPAMGDRPQALLNKQILSKCDILVGVFWTRIGTSTGAYESGTVEEIEEHIAAQKPAMLYFSNAPVVPTSIDSAQYAVLNEFREKCKTRGLYSNYSDVNDFKHTFYRQLQLKLNESDFLPPSKKDSSPQPSALPDIPSFSKEAQALLIEASKDSHGGIMRLEHTNGLIVQTNGKGFVPDNSPRDSAIWESALKELESAGFVLSDSDRQFFKMTRKGYDIAEIIS